MSVRALDNFRHTLRSLIEATGSIAEVCRDLELNRQQMAKYLSGESLPSVPLLVKICDYFGVSTDVAHQPLTEVMLRDDDKLITILRGFTRGPFAASVNEKRIAHPFADGYYMMWQPSVWRNNLVARQLTQVKTIGQFQQLRHCSPVDSATGKRIRSRNYSMTLALGDNTQFVILTFFRRRGVNSWAVSQFREAGFRAAPHYCGITVGSANWENVNMVGAARVVLERVDMTGQSLLGLARSSRIVPVADVPQHVLKHLHFEGGEFPDIITPF